MKWTRGEGSYSNKTNSDIDTWRQNQINSWDNDGLTGTIIMGEGRVWVYLEGADSDVDAAMRGLVNDSFLDGFMVTDDNNSISSRDLSTIYSYHEDRSPRTP